MSSALYYTATGTLNYFGATGTAGVLMDRAGNLPLIPLTIPIAALNGYYSTGLTTFQGLGLLTIDPSNQFSTNGKISRTLTFQSILEVTVGVTAEVRLYNITGGYAVTGSTLTSTATSPTLVSGSLTIGSSPNILNSSQLYEVQLRISVPSSPADTDRAICKMGSISITWS